mmetsp:Transcript_30103/g.79327  ORF Transcript_30103/g.79327 Transcript_30103/m.79327 type:complete len:1187 (-) Transcript_30103:141-3701(-)
MQKFGEALSTFERKSCDTCPTSLTEGQHKTQSITTGFGFLRITPWALSIVVLVVFVRAAWVVPADAASPAAAAEFHSAEHVPVSRGCGDSIGFARGLVKIGRLWAIPRGPQRRLAAGTVSQQAAEEAEPTLDEVDSVLFSRPPYSEQSRSMLVYYSVSGMYVLCALILLIGANLDAAERRRRLARAIVPQEFVSHRFFCCRVTMPQENVPCEITEQYYLDGRLLALRSADEVAGRKQRIGLLGYILRNAGDFMEVLLREHLAFSFLPKAIPTFTRVKRAGLMVVQLHLCMLIGAMVFNIREHTAPMGRYEVLTCGSALATDCFATAPAAFLAAIVACPLFRFAVFQHTRLTCFVSQSHPSTSHFPLGMRKFASLAPRSLFESLLCMRNGYERQKARVAQSRSLVHRAVHVLWQTTRSSIRDLRFYSPVVSWLLSSAMLAFVGGAAAYVLLFTVFLKDVVVYHWLVWISVMLASWVIVLEPLLLFWTQVLWCSLVEATAQRWGYGSHALAATTKYKDIVREVDEVVVAGLRNVASVRIQRWWLGMLDMHRHINEQTAAAIKIQSVRKKMSQKKKFLKERKWCMRVDVLDCGDFEEVFGMEEMSPFIRLKCDVGNPNVSETKIAWNVGPSATFNETFFVDIKESNAMHVEAWCKGLTMEEFVGRGSFDFNSLKSKEENADWPDGHTLKIELWKGGPQEHSPRPRGSMAGHVNLRVTFLDPLKEQCGSDGQEDWMLPKNRMKFALSKMGPGGRLKVGKMLGSLTPKSNLELAGPQAPGEAMDESGRSTATESMFSGSSGNRPLLQAKSQSGQGEQQYLADNSLLQAESAGLAYRHSKDLNAHLDPPQAALWGSHVQGLDEGDGWLRVRQGSAAMFLPMTLQGVPVLVKSGAVPAALSSAPAGAAAGSSLGQAPKTAVAPMTGNNRAAGLRVGGAAAVLAAAVPAAQDEDDRKEHGRKVRPLGGRGGALLPGSGGRAGFNGMTPAPSGPPSSAGSAAIAAAAAPPPGTLTAVPPLPPSGNAGRGGVAAVAMPAPANSSGSASENGGAGGGGTAFFSKGRPPLGMPPPPAAAGPLPSGGRPPLGAPPAAGPPLPPAGGGGIGKAGGGGGPAAVTSATTTSMAPSMLPPSVGPPVSTPPASGSPPQQQPQGLSLNSAATGGGGRGGSGDRVLEAPAAPMSFPGFVPEDPNEL